MPEPTKDELEAAVEWTAQAQAILGSGVEYMRTALKDGVDSLAVVCNDRWGEVDQGATLEFGASDLGDDSLLKIVSEDVAVAFAGQTALLLLGGADGPFLTAVVLREGIDKLADEIEGKT